ncbi:hypothetical protein Droror1_Dr00000069 [Drosera rotundifolia]
MFPSLLPRKPQESPQFKISFPSIPLFPPLRRLHSYRLPNLPSPARNDAIDSMGLVDGSGLVSERALSPVGAAVISVVNPLDVAKVYFLIGENNRSPVFFSKHRGAYPQEDILKCFTSSIIFELMPSIISIRFFELASGKLSSQSDPVKELLADAKTKSKKLEVESKGQKTAPSNSVSCRPFITNSEGTSDAVYPHRLQVLATAPARCHVMKLKVSSIFSPFDLDQCIVFQI